MNKKNNFKNISAKKEMMRPESKNMANIKPQPSKIKKEILNEKIQDKSKLVGQIRDDIKKMRENNISIFWTRAN